MVGEVAGRVPGNVQDLEAMPAASIVSPPSTSTSGAHGPDEHAAQNAVGVSSSARSPAGM